MEDIILQKDIRRFFLGKSLYNRCLAGGRLTERDLFARAGQLQLRDPIFKNIEVSDLVRLCGLRSGTESMDIEEEEEKTPTTREFRPQPLPFMPFNPIRQQFNPDLLGPPPPLVRQDVNVGIPFEIEQEEDLRHPSDIEAEMFERQGLTAPFVIVEEEEDF